MSREWQQTRFRDIVMPDAVYYQSIWAVRDLERMEKRLDLIRIGEDAALDRMEADGVQESGSSYQDAERRAKLDAEKEILESRITAIRAALEEVPEMYRNFLLDNIVRKKNDSCFPNKLWRVWKQRFLFRVAKNLELI